MSIIFIGVITLDVMTFAEMILKTTTKFKQKLYYQVTHSYILFTNVFTKIYHS